MYIQKHQNQSVEDQSLEVAVFPYIKYTRRYRRMYCLAEVWELECSNPLTGEVEVSCATPVAHPGDEENSGDKLTRWLRKMVAFRSDADDADACTDIAILVLIVKKGMSDESVIP